MKNFLSLSRASKLHHHRNITKRVKAIPLDGCDKCTELTQDVGTINAKSGDCFCFDSVEYASFLFGAGLEIEGISDADTKLGPVQNAYAVTCGYYKATARQDTKIEYFLNEIDLNQNEERSKYNQKVVMQDWTGTIQTEYDVKNVETDEYTQTADVLYTAAHEVTVSYDSDSSQISAYVDGDWKEGLPKQGSVTGGFVEFSTFPELPEPTTVGKYTSKAQVTVKINQKPDYYPTTIIEKLEPYKIYTVNDNNNPDDPDDSDGLSAGAIAGIVIACVVFCVVWFVVLKKSCGKGSKSQNAEA